MTPPQISLERASERRTLLMLALACGLLIAGGAALPLATDGQSRAPVVQMGDVSDAQIVEIRDHRGVTVLSGEFRSRVDALGNTELDAALADRQGRPAIGEIEVEIPAPDRGRHLELEVDVIGLPPLERFTVFIDDRAVAIFTTDDRGSIDRELQEGEATS